ncbi:MAG: 6,7-dimethyl-8-ribityllumazine synthase [Candidatus Margulisiibacteriota bacterium]
MGKNLDQTPAHFIEPKIQKSGSLIGTNLKIGIVCAKFNQWITQSLLMGCIQGLKEHQVNEDNISTYWVPGAFEVPVIVDRIFPQYDAVIAIACVIQGGTPHFDYVCDSITQGITLANNTHQKPGIFCVLTTNTVEQAEERSKANCTSNKGYEAALAAIEMANLINDEA